MKGLMKKALSFVMMMAMVATMLVLPNVDAKAAEDDMVLVYAKDTSDTSDWGDLYLYAWNGGDNAGAWPGTAMTADANNPGWYYAFMPNTMKNFIINNNNGKQTDDKELETGAIGQNLWITVDSTVAKYTTEKLTNGDLPAYKAPDVVVIDKNVPNITAHVKVLESWNNPYIWAWNGGENAYAQWPGAAITVEKDGWLTLEVPGWVNSVIISDKDTGAQTSNISIEAGKDFWLTVKEDLTADVVYTAPAGSTTPEGGSTTTPEGGSTTPEGGSTTTPEGGSTTPEGGSTTPEANKPATKYEQKYKTASIVGNFADKLKNCNIKESWNEKSTAGDMEYLGNGIYKFVVTFDKTDENVTVEYKVAFDHSWDHNIAAKSTSTAEGFQDGGVKNLTIDIPAGSTSVTIVANEADFAAYDSIQNEAAMNKLLAIAKDGIPNTGDNAYLYALLLVAGCAVVVFASKKKFA